jgi:glycyl-tRNA synthetase
VPDNTTVGTGHYQYYLLTFSERIETMLEMDKLVSLAKRRGFLFQSSEIYGGFQGFWDYGPLGVLLKKNVKEAWWQDMVTRHDDLTPPEGAPSSFDMVGLDCTIIMSPQVWKVSGHYDLFVDQMIDCKQSKKRYRYDQVRGRWVEAKGKRLFIAVSCEAEEEVEQAQAKALKYFNIRAKNAEELAWDGDFIDLPAIEDLSQVLGPDAKEPGTLTSPRDFNLMFKTIVGALGTEEDAAFLRPETAQGIFVNFKNVLDSTRIKVPFGVAQVGKSFRNEITPRNFTFRSREFEQMEIEFFCHPDQSRDWYEYWRNRRMKWYTDMGLSGERLQLREHHPEELAHYSVGTADIEYAFPFLPEGEYGELEGVAHRGDFDLRSHMEGKLKQDESGQLVVEKDANGQPKHRGSGKDLTYFDEEMWEAEKESTGFSSFQKYAKDRGGDGSPYRYTPHVIEPSAGADRATLAFLCEAYTEDEQPDEKGNMQTRVVLKFHPRIAPIKAAVFPLVKKDGMPEIAQEIYRGLKRAGLEAFYDEKGAVGRRYRRQDEVGTPYCITVDGQTLEDKTVTVRDRDTLEQWRVSVDQVVEDVRKRIES